MQSVLGYYMAVNFAHLVYLYNVDRQSLQSYDSKPPRLSHVKFFRSKFSVATRSIKNTTCTDLWVRSLDNDLGRKEYTMNIWKQDFKENIWVREGRRTLENKNKQGDRGNVTWERLNKIYKFILIWYTDVERMQNWKIYRTLILPYDFICSLYVDKFRLTELTKEREHIKFIPGLFVVVLNI